MALIRCHECGYKVSTEAAACPKCGAKPKIPEPKPEFVPTKGQKLIVGVAGVLLLMWMFPWLNSKSEEAKTQAVACETDFSCTIQRATLAAGNHCPAEIEKLAKRSVRWIDGTIEPKFSRGRWRDGPGSGVTMIGDKAEFQNGFGAWTRMIYECDLSPKLDGAVAVRVKEGRLP